MTTRQNTNNPCPSNALADLNDNTIIIDEWVNSKNDYTTDRFGNQFQTKHKILSDFRYSVDKIQSGSFLPISSVHTNENGIPIYRIGNQVDFSQTPTVNGQPVVTDLSGVQEQITSINNKVNPVCNHVSVIPHETEGRTDIASNSYQSIFSIRDDGICGMWDSVQQRWRFLFDQNGNLVVGNICYNQRWHNLTNERQSGVVYLNTIGKPIMISISCVSGNVLVSNVEVARVNGTGNQVMSAVIPDGFAYMVNGEFALWSELR